MGNLVSEANKFDGICEEILPIAEQLIDILKKNRIDEKEIAGLSVSSDGYINFRISQSCEMVRVSADSEIRLRYEWGNGETL